MKNQIIARVLVVSLWSKDYPKDNPKHLRVDMSMPAGAEPIDVLEEAFMVTNRDDRPGRTEIPSTSIGDLMFYNDQWYMVDREGFEPLKVEQAVKAMSELTSRDTGMGYAWLHEHNYL